LKPIQADHLLKQRLLVPVIMRKKERQRLPQTISCEYKKSQIKELKNQINEPQSDHSYEALYSENYRLKEALAKATQFTKADQISTNETGFTIPKEKYEHVKVAMENRRDSEFLIFDKSGILERTESDVLTETKK
jgi:hypothetical protein